MSINGIRKLFISSAGDFRTEMDMTMNFNGHQTTNNMISIGHADKPEESIILDDEAKTYSVLNVNKLNLNNGTKTQSTVTKIGEENIMGFQSVHARIFNTTTNSGMLITTDTMEIWKSSEIPLPDKVKEWIDHSDSKSMSVAFAPDVAPQLKQMGCVGMFVKIIVKGKNSSTNWELTKVEHKDLPASIFQIPAGYTEDKSANF